MAPKRLKAKAKAPAAESAENTPRIASQSSKINSWILRENDPDWQAVFAKHLLALLPQDSESLTEIAQTILVILESRYRKDQNSEDRDYLWRIAHRATAGLRTGFLLYPESIRELASELTEWPILTNPREHKNDAKLLADLGVGTKSARDVSATGKPRNSTAAQIVRVMLTGMTRLWDQTRSCPIEAFVLTHPRQKELLENVRNLPPLFEKEAPPKWWEVFKLYFDIFSLHDGLDTLGLPPVKKRQVKHQSGINVEIDETKAKFPSEVRRDAKNRLKKAFYAELRKSRN